MYSLLIFSSILIFSSEGIIFFLGGGNMIVSAAVDSNERRDAFKKLCKAAQSDGALVVAQFNHAGPQTPEFINSHPFSVTDQQVKPRGVCRFGKPVPLTTEQVRSEVSWYRILIYFKFLDNEADREHNA